MLRLKKPLLLLLALSVVGVSLTSAQAMDELFAARQRDQDRRVRNNPGDDGVAFAQLRERLHRKWQEDLEAARRKRKRINLGQKRRNKRKEGIQAPVAASGQYVYFPSGSATDAKFLVLAGPVGTGTLVNELNIKLAAPSTATSVDLAIFDGDMAGAWDQGTGNLTYTLYRDPNADGTGTVPVPGASWTGAQMTDNAWTALTDSGSVNGGVSVPVDAGAQSPSGNYFYVLKIQLSGTSAGTAACMKFRTNASVRLEPQDSFTIIGALGSTADLNRVYPNYPSLTPTTYDGVWDLFTYVPLSLEYDPLDNSRPTAFEVWDGDFDLGDASLATNDTDDANTPNSVSLLPDWASSTSPVAEGVAVGRNGATGAPQDDAASLLFQRAPSVRYDVTDPSGVRYFNLNPSGNQEWERFRIETNPFTKNSPSVADAAATGSNLPAGVYQVHIDGLDMANLNALRFEHDILGVDEHGNPVQPLLPYNLGDTVWLDADGDGTQNGGELGIAGVNVTLLDDSGNVLLTDVTDASGLYSFNVAAGTYTVRVEASNFVSGNPLAGLNSTTGGQEITGEITTANVLTFDYGYRGAPSGSIGDFVWLDVDGDGIQDDGEPGIGGVTVTLGGDSSATTTTDVNGFYLFTGLDTLAAHNYTVTVSGDPLTGLTQTFDFDGVASANTSSVAVAIASNNLAQDFGFRGTGRIGDLIWLDANGDNTYTLGTDAGLAGVRVNLTWDYNGDGSVDLKQSTTTDLAGAYLFSGLPPATAPGSYTVRVDTNTLPYGVTLVADPDGAATPSYSTLTLASGAANLLQDFGYSGSGSIGDLVWHDADGDGVKDTGESGIANVGLTLTADFDLNGTTDYQSTTRTNASGLYLFSGLGAGRYRVTVNTGGALSGWTQTYDLDGTGTANTAAGALSARASNLSFDFGYNGVTDAPASVGDFVWIDGDGDGVQDSSELGLSGVQVKLYNTSNVQVGSTQTTNSTGYYAFTNLAPATYYVTFTLPSGYVFAGQDLGGNEATDSDPNTGTGQTANFTLVAGQNLTTVDAGAYQTASVGDYVWVDLNRDGTQTSGEAGLAGVQVKLFNTSDIQVGSTQTTLADGAYSFTNVTPGDYYVQFTLPAGYSFTTANVGSDAADSDAIVTGNPLVGDTAEFTLAAGDDLTTVDAGALQSGSVGDFIWIDSVANNVQDVGETGLAGVVARLYNSADVLLATAPATGSSGAYSFGGLAAGTYYVTFTLPDGYTFVTQDAGGDTVDSDANATTGKTANFTLAEGENRTDIDAGAIVTPNNSVGDYVWDDQNANGIQDSGEYGLSGVAVELYHDTNVKVGSTITTGANGAYLFTGLADDTDYYVKFTLPGSYIFSTQGAGGDAALDSDAATGTGLTATFSLTGGTNLRTIDAGAYVPASVGDFVWLDANANGVQDFTDNDGDGVPEATDGNGVWDVGEPGEGGLAGATVKLFTSADSQVGSSIVTTGTGAYSFTGLPSGSYYVEFTLPGGYVFSAKDQGGNDAADSDVDTVTGRTATFTLTSGSNPITWDAGAYATASVGNYLWNDADEDGVQDGSEAGLAGVTVQLFNSSDNTLAKPAQTTLADGAYSFTGLAPGSYYVVFGLPDGYAFSGRDLGGDDATDSDADPSTGATDTFTLTSGTNLDTIDGGASSVPSGAVGNNIWLDANLDGLNNNGESLYTGSVTVKLFSSNGVQLASQTTSTGVYGFSGLDAGSYYVTFTLNAGTHSFTSTDEGSNDAIDSDANPSSGRTANFTLGRGETRNDIDAGVSATVTTASVGNYIWRDLDGDGVQDTGEPGIGGAVVRLYTSTGSLVATSAATPYDPLAPTATNYLFTGLSAGSYYIKVTLPAGYVFSPLSQGGDTALDSDVDISTSTSAVFTLGNGQARTDLDAGASISASIGQVVWYDANRNGIWERLTESGLAGVTVTLAGPDGLSRTTTTDSSGLYLFSGLEAGNYTVTVAASTISTAVIPAATRFRTYDYDGFAASPDVATYQLSAGENCISLNFGYSIAPYVAPVGAQWRTQTQGGWGQDPTTRNAGGFLNTHWLTISDTGTVPAGQISIGLFDTRDSGNTNRYVRVDLTPRTGVTNLLPTGGTAAQHIAPTTGNVTTVYTNPIYTDAGVLLGQCVAVELAVRFSAAGITKTGLGARKLSLSGNAYSGMTVSAILNEGHLALGGRAKTYWSGTVNNNTRLSQLNDALSAINENYVDGTVDMGHIVDP